MFPARASVCDMERDSQCQSFCVPAAPLPLFVSFVGTGAPCLSWVFESLLVPVAEVPNITQYLPSCLSPIVATTLFLNRGPRLPPAATRPKTTFFINVRWAVAD